MMNFFKGKLVVFDAKELISLYKHKDFGESFYEALHMYEQEEVLYRLLLEEDLESPEIQLLFGMGYYLYFTDERKNKEQAIEWFKKAHSNGIKVASLYIAKCYEKSSDNYIYWLNEAAKNENMEAYLLIGIFHFETGQYELGLNWYLKAAEKEYTYAYKALAECYEEGHGVKQDYEEAYKWYKKLEEEFEEWGILKVMQYDHHRCPHCKKFFALKGEGKEKVCENCNKTVVVEDF